MKEYVLVMRAKDHDALGSIRNLSYLKIAMDDDLIWLSGISTMQDIDLKIRQLPLQHTFILDDKDNLFPVNGLTPVGKLKSLEWKAISTFINVALPTSAMPGSTEQKYKVKLVHTDRGREGAALLTSFSVWEDYAIHAPEIRLSRLKFAVSKNKEALILGTPLPAIPGKEFWMENDFIIPSGYDFEIPMVIDLAQRTINQQKDAMVLFNEEGAWVKIPRLNFVNASRSAVRQTRQNLLP